MEKETLELLRQIPYDVETLNLDKKGIVGILDMNKFIKLKILLCSDNKITELVGLSNTIDILGCADNQITKLILPEYLTKHKIYNNPVKTFYYSFDEEFSEFKYYKDTLETLILSVDYNYPVEPIGYTKLKKIIFNRVFDTPIDNLCEYNLEELEFRTECVFNQTINLKKSYIKKITFVKDSLFNQLVDNLPESLEYLELGDNFNQPVDSLPKTLVKLIIGNVFNQPVDNLPNTLKHLELGDTFNYPVDNLPSGLEYLNIGYEFTNLINNLPEKLLNLRIGCKFREEVKSLPNGLLEISFGRGFDASLDAFPPTLRKISFSRNFNQSVDCLSPNLIYLKLSRFFRKTIDSLPESLETLIIGEYFNNPVDNLPSGLKELEFDTEMGFNHPLNNLPNQLEKLTLGMQYNQSLDNLPESITYLNLYGYLGNINKLPPNLNYFILDNYHEDILNKYLPESLVYFETNMDIQKFVLPKNLKKLKINYNAQKITKDVLPENLESLELKFEVNKQKFIKSLPNNLKNFIFGNLDKEKINITNNLINILPKTLQSIWINGKIKVSHIEKLPKNLTKTLLFLENDDELYFY